MKEKKRTTEAKQKNRQKYFSTCLDKTVTTHNLINYITVLIKTITAQIPI